MPQTVVITGASAGVGRATALAFARRRWTVALLARDPGGIEDARKEVEQAGGRALTIAADVADADALFAAAAQVAEQCGSIDVWVNNAMATTFAPVAEMSAAEFRRVTEVTYLGTVYGTMAALKHMRRRNAGTIVQVGSALSYRAIPLQSAYCGGKFAVRGFTDALRSELQHDKSAVRITMVHIPAVNTPQFEWARNKMARPPQPMGSIHQPEPVAEAIVRACEQVPREAWVGWPTVKAIIGTMIMPGFLDRWLARRAVEGQLAIEPQRGQRAGNLFEPVAGTHATHGRFDDRARNFVPSFNSTTVRGAIIYGGIIAVSAVAIAAFALLYR